MVPKFKAKGGPWGPCFLVLTGCPWGAHHTCLSAPSQSSFSLLLTCSSGTWEPCLADGVFLALQFRAIESTYIAEEQGEDFCSHYQGTPFLEASPPAQDALLQSWRDSPDAPPLSVSSNTNYLSLDILFCFLLLSKLGEFSNRFKSFGKQSILLRGREYIPDFLFEGWMQRRKTEWRKSPLISQNITQPQLSAIHCWA